jgi:hypothetical protein
VGGSSARLARGSMGGLDFFSSRRTWWPGSGAPAPPTRPPRPDPGGFWRPATDTGDPLRSPADGDGRPPMRQLGRSRAQAAHPDGDVVVGEVETSGYALVCEFVASEVGRRPPQSWFSWLQLLGARAELAVLHSESAPVPENWSMRCRRADPAPGRPSSVTGPDKTQGRRASGGLRDPLIALAATAITSAPDSSTNGLGVMPILPATRRPHRPGVTVSVPAGECESRGSSWHGTADIVRLWEARR